METPDALRVTERMLLDLLTALDRDLNPPLDISAAVDSYNEFVYGADYDPCPERRYVRAHGGHCSGGGGCS